ncbi:MAG: hypothetical protein ACOY0T_36870 [Myxococcota bacterium]
MRIRTTSLVIAIIALSARASVAEAPTLAGRWSASPLRSDWNVGDWGTACGPRPSGGGAAGGNVEVTSSGTELAIAFPGRNFSTTECWEQFPGLTRTSHKSGSRGWQTRCQTAPGDPRQATVVTTISATDNQIRFDETGQYQFVIQGQNCTASVRRTRVLTLVRRQGDPEPAPIASAAPAAQPERKPQREPRCATTGLPERLEVRPSRKLMRPGEEFTFRASVLDASNCPLGITPVWTVASGGASVQLSGQGKVVIPQSAPEAIARLQVTVADRSVAVEVEVVSRERYDALLKQGEFNAEGESSEAAIARIASSTIGARSGVGEDEAHTKKIAFVAVVGGLSLSLGMLGLLIVLRGRRRAPAALGTGTQRLSVPQPSAAAPRATKVCPTCREEYPSGAEFCASDGNRLIALSPGTAVGPTGGVCPVCGQGYDPGVEVCPKHQEPLVPALAVAQRRQAPTYTHKICPICGMQFPGDSQFCGKCGAALVPVN